MKERIEIDNDRVRLLRLAPTGEWKAELELPYKAFMELLVTELPEQWENLPLLPPGCRWYGRKRRAEVMIVEEPPSSRRMRFAAKTRRRGDEAPEELYELAFPYVIYALLFIDGAFEEMKVFFRPAPLRTLEDPLYLSSLFNVQLSLGHRAQSRACIRPKPDVRGLPLHEKVQQLVSHFWNTEFNLDIEDNGFEFYSGRHAEFSSLARWQEESRSDPLFVLRFAWESAKLNVLGVIGFLMAQYRHRRTALSALSLADLCYSLIESQNKRPVFDHRTGFWRD